MDKVWGKFGKRIFDLTLAIFVSVIFAPIIIGVAAIVYTKLGGPVLFKQERLGKDGRKFLIYKFRSMTDKRDAGGNLLADELRLDSFGKLLRSTSLDELPQLYNIIRGEMSFVGPRATLVSYKELLYEEYPMRFNVLPGMTSLPAIRGRNHLSWDEKFSLDVEYVENFGLMMDLNILVRTIPVVLRREGISSQGMETATRYDKQ